MSRLQLELRDLARLTVGTTLGRHGESLLSLDVLRDRHRSPLTASWERAVRTGIDGWTTALLAVPPADLMAAVRWCWEVPNQPPSIAVIDGGGCDRRGLRTLLRRYQEVALDPYWPSIVAHLEAERARRGQLMAAQGVGELLATLHPRIRWRPPLLEVDAGRGGHGVGRRAPVPLDATSVALVPSVFCLDRPRVVMGRDVERSPCLVIYPALRGVEEAVSLWAREVPLQRPALASALGRTRACALEAIASTCSTTELARRIGVSPATASHHADVLRKARLVVSRRVGSATSHRLTALGAALLGVEGHERPVLVRAAAARSDPGA
ncbi:MAG: ArsR/SmtB family transcription factor [Acidimicrobiales bacterium]